MSLASSCFYYLVWILVGGGDMPNWSELLGIVMWACGIGVDGGWRLGIPVVDSIFVDVGRQLFDGLDVKSRAAGLVDGKRFIGHLWSIGSNNEPSPRLFQLKIALGALILEEADESFINTFYGTDK